jgi:hypothetical protein
VLKSFLHRFYFLKYSKLVVAPFSISKIDMRF